MTDLAAVAAGGGGGANALVAAGGDDAVELDLRAGRRSLLKPEQSKAGRRRGGARGAVRCGAVRAWARSVAWTGSTSGSGLGFGCTHVVLLEAVRHRGALEEREEVPDGVDLRARRRRRRGRALREQRHSIGGNSRRHRLRRVVVGEASATVDRNLVVMIAKR